MASAGKENTAPAASADTAELEAQLRESRMENELLQAELNSVADTAKTLKKQLECVFLLHFMHARSSSAPVHSINSTRRQQQALCVWRPSVAQGSRHAAHVLPPDRLCEYSILPSQRLSEVSNTPTKHTY
jgi:hypothetical protein